MYVLDTVSLVYRITLCEQTHQSQTPNALERCFLRTGILNTNSHINECWRLWTRLKYRSLPGIFHSCLPTGLIGSPKDWVLEEQEPRFLMSAKAALCHNTDVFSPSANRASNAVCVESNISHWSWHYCSINASRIRRGGGFFGGGIDVS